jgi:hypothetical protein
MVVAQKTYMLGVPTRIATIPTSYVFSIDSIDDSGENVRMAWSFRPAHSNSAPIDSYTVSIAPDDGVADEDIVGEEDTVSYSGDPVMEDSGELVVSSLTDKQEVIFDPYDYSTVTGKLFIKQDSDNGFYKGQIDTDRIMYSVSGTEVSELDSGAVEFRTTLAANVAGGEPDAQTQTITYAVGSDGWFAFDESPYVSKDVEYTLQPGEVVEVVETTDPITTEVTPPSRWRILFDDGFSIDGADQGLIELAGSTSQFRIKGINAVEETTQQLTLAVSVKNAILAGEGETITDTITVSYESTRSDSKTVEATVPAGGRKEVLVSFDDPPEGYMQIRAEGPVNAAGNDAYVSPVSEPQEIEPSLNVSCGLPEDRVLTTESLTVNAVVSAGGGDVNVDATVAVEVGGESVTKTVTLSPNTSQTVEAIFPDLPAGSYSPSVSLV